MREDINYSNESPPSPLDPILSALESGLLEPKTLAAREPIYRKIILSLLETLPSMGTLLAVEIELDKVREIMGLMEPEGVTLSKTEQEILSALKNLGCDKGRARRILG